MLFLIVILISAFKGHIFPKNSNKNVMLELSNPKKNLTIKMFKFIKDIWDWGK